MLTVISPLAVLDVMNNTLGQLLEKALNKREVWFNILTGTKEKMKLVLFLQLFEEQFLANWELLVHQELFYTVLGKFMLIFDLLNIAYMDYPALILKNSGSGDTSEMFERFSPMTPQTTMGRPEAGRQKKYKDLRFYHGGPLRCFMFVLLQSLRRAPDSSKFEWSLDLFKFYILRDSYEVFKPFIGDTCRDDGAKKEAMRAFDGKIPSLATLLSPIHFNKNE